MLCFTIANFEADSDIKEKCLAFSAGCIINLIDNRNPAWWVGELVGKVGFFPANFVELLDATPLLDVRKLRIRSTHVVPALSQLSQIYTNDISSPSSSSSLYPPLSSSTSSTTSPYSSSSPAIDTCHVQ